MSTTKKLITLIVIPILGLTCIAWFLISHGNEDLIEIQAEKMAETVANQVITDRKHYVQSIVGAVKGTDIAPIPTGGYDKDSGKVPLPAEFIRFVSEDVAASQSNYKYKLVSRWNINEGNSLSDEFLSDGFTDLMEQEKAAKDSGVLSAANPFKEWKPVMKRVVVDGKPVFRYIRADVAVGAACVSCHNTLEDSPAIKSLRKAANVEEGKVFELNDLMGAIAVDIDLEEVSAASAANIQWFFIIGFGATVVVIGVVVFGALRLLKPIIGVADLAETVAQGDLTGESKLGAGQKDEVGVLVRSVNSMTSSLREMMLDITSNSKTLSGSSKRMSETSGVITVQVANASQQSMSAAAATEQASANIREVASAIEQIDENSNAVASSAEEVSSNLTTVGAAVEEMSSNMGSVSTAVEEMSGTINTVSEAVQTMETSLNDVKNCTDEAQAIADDATKKATETSEVVNNLGTSAVEIGRVVDMITGIADQTNLLALNATIEAASAGDAGKGFGVVANEVKELAKQTSTATEEIRTQVETMQGNTGEVVNAIEEIAKTISDISRAFTNVNTSVSEQSEVTSSITSDIKGVADYATSVSRNVHDAALGATEVSQNVQDASVGMNEIARSITELSIGAGKVVTNVNEVAEGLNDASQNVQSVNASIEDTKRETVEVSSTAQQLSSMADQLHDLVERFKI
jgi:methyl-accepting chemotaxis protein